MADDRISPQEGSTGYRRPPVETRFRKGQSGNPSGKRKGSRNRPRASRLERLRSLLLEEAYRPITVNQDGGEVVMPMAQAVLRSLAVAAARGETRAQAMFIKIVGAIEEEEAAIEEMLEAEREEPKDEKRKIQIMIVDPVDGTRTPYRPDGSPEPTTGKVK
jgi:Family of unknown function (DUF5681)